VENQLGADETEDGGQAVAQVHQLAERSLQDEVERPQPEQRKRVGGEDQVRVAGDAVDGGHGVHGEDDVGGEDGDHDERLHHGGLIGEVGVDGVRRHADPRGNARPQGCWSRESNTARPCAVDHSLIATYDVASVRHAHAAIASTPVHS
jgi:hypothetical protein